MSHAGASSSCLALALALFGCATTSAEQPKTAAYPGRCDLLAVEEVERPADRPSDQVALVARYGFGAPSESAAEPVSLSFLVTRERAEDLRAHLAAHPSVVCNPGDQQGSRVELPPFEGQSGVVEP